MKDILYSNYDIRVDEIYIKNNKHFFFINNNKIYIYECSKEELDKINKLIIITNELYKIIKVNTFIKNKNNTFFTKHNENFIVLVKVNNIENDFDKNDIYKFWNINTNLDNYNIIDEWTKEVDDLENKMIEYNKEFQLIQESINYFIGMAENAIELLNDNKKIINNYNDSIGHKLSYELFNSNSLYNPFTFIKTNKMYDVSNYIKYIFLKNEIDYNEVESFFINGSEYENIFLFCNLLYPSVYFDLVKKILAGEEEESKIKLFINKIKKYNKLLRFCKKIVKNNKNIQLINWFDK